MNIYREEDLPGLRRAGRVAARTLSRVGAWLRPGMTTAAIDTYVRRDTRKQGARPSQLGYHGFPATVCTSRNSVVCHGIPNKTERLEPGDIINVDVTSNIGGFHGDTSRTFAIGRVSPEGQHVMSVAERCLEAGIAAVRAGARLGDIGGAIRALAHQEGCSVVTDFGGHGIGRKMHEGIHMPHDATPGTGIVLAEGMVFTIEPMINLGSPEVRLLADGWTAVTRDGSLSAQFEHTIRVTRDGAEILTPRPA